jgi:hypothetical protein
MPYLIAEIIVDAEFDDAGSDAFRPLFNYISGDNKSQQDIVMTAPVSQEASGEEIPMTSPVEQQNSVDKWAVSFMIPDKYTPETVPEPTDSDVNIREVPARYITVLLIPVFGAKVVIKSIIKNYKSGLMLLGTKSPERLSRHVMIPLLNLGF